MSTPVTLRQYEYAERVIAREGARTGLIIHSIVTVLVSVALVWINIGLAPEFAWSPFPVAGMLIGLAIHWWFGYHKLDEQLTQQQHDVEARALELR